MQIMYQIQNVLARIQELIYRPWQGHAPLRLQSGVVGETGGYCLRAPTTSK